MLTLRKKAHGLSIAELLVASGLLAMVLVTVMTLFGQLIRNTEKNALLAAGAVFADGVIDRFTAKAQENIDLNSTATTHPEGFKIPELSGAGTKYVLEDGVGLLNVEKDGPDGATKYLYRVEAQELLLTPSGSTDPRGQLWKLDVEVRWWQGDTSTAAASRERAGMGNMNVHRSSIVYLEY